MPEGNKSRVSGDGVGSKRPATNSPGIAVDSKWFNCLVEKSGLGVEPRPESPVTNRGFFCALHNRGLARRICEGYIIKGTKRTWFWTLEYFIKDCLLVPTVSDRLAGYI